MSYLAKRMFYSCVSKAFLARFIPGAILSVAFLTLVLIGCEKKEGDSIFLMVNPRLLVIEAEPGTSVMFQIDAESNKQLTQLVIKKQLDYSQSSILLDTLLNTKKLEYYYAFLVPEVADSSSIILDFAVKNSEPASVALRRRVLVKNESELLDETTGHVMHSALSGKPSAFNIEFLQPLFPEDHPDSFSHIADASIDTIHQNTLSRRWRSPAGLSFVKFQGFNYATATTLSLQNAYDVGLKLSSVESIQDDDVILVGVEDKAKAAIYISQVIDGDSTLNDRYVFSIKRRKPKK